MAVVCLSLLVCHLHSVRWLIKRCFALLWLQSSSLPVMAACYGSKCSGTMSDVRFAVWQYKTGHSQSKSFKLPSLPPTSESFELHVKRAHHQACIWMDALESEPPALAAAEYGWKVHNSNKSLLPIAMPADAMPAPAPVLSLLCCMCSADEACSSRRCSCHRSGTACSIFLQLLHDTSGKLCKPHQQPCSSNIR